MRFVCSLSGVAFSNLRKLSPAAHLGEQGAPWLRINEDETVHKVSCCTCKPVSPLRKCIESSVFCRFRAKRTRAAETLGLGGITSTFMQGDLTAPDPSHVKSRIILTVSPHDSDSVRGTRSEMVVLELVPSFEMTSLNIDCRFPLQAGRHP